MMNKVFLNANSKHTHKTDIAKAKHLISWCLQADPRKRPTSKDLCDHPFFKNSSPVPTFEIKYHAFVSHAQMESSGEAAALDFTLRRIGVYSWRDMSQSEITAEGMKKGVESSDTFILLLTESTLSRWFCLLEIGWALRSKKNIIIVVETNPRFASWDFERWTRNETIKNTYVVFEFSSQSNVYRLDTHLLHHKKISLEKQHSNTKHRYGPTLSITYDKIDEQIRKEITRQHKSGLMIPYRRRDFEARAMTREILSRLGIRYLPPITRMKNVRGSVLIIADCRDKTARKARSDMRINLNSKFGVLEVKDSPSRIIILLTKNVFQCEECRRKIIQHSKLPVVFVMMTQNVSKDVQWLFSGQDESKEGSMHIIRKVLPNIEVLEYRSVLRMYEHVSMLREMINRFRPIQLSDSERKELNSAAATTATSK